VGYQALLSNADLRSRTALGYVTELLSGDYLAAFGRSSHHQVWSEAMVATPLVRGLLGLSVEDGGRSIRFAPQLPADWKRVAASHIPAGGGQVDLTLVRAGGEDRVVLERRSDGSGPLRVLLAPSYPLDARIEAIALDGRAATFSIERLGDVQRPRLVVEGASRRSQVVIRYRPGTDVYLRHSLPETGSRSAGLRILRSRADDGSLRLLLEGRGGKTYSMLARSPRRLRGAPGVVVRPAERGAFTLEVAFEGSPEAFVRRELVLPLE
jgi:hypothetical protein